MATSAEYQFHTWGSYWVRTEARCLVVLPFRRPKRRGGLGDSEGMSRLKTGSVIWLAVDV